MRTHTMAKAPLSPSTKAKRSRHSIEVHALSISDAVVLMCVSDNHMGVEQSSYQTKMKKKKRKAYVCV